MPERGPGRPSSIDRAQLVRTALEIAGLHGFSAVSAREITTRLGVSPMAIYRHVPTMADLRAEVADAALAEVPAPEPDQDWRGQLRAFAGELATVCWRYRGLESEPVLGAQPRRIAGVLEDILRSVGHEPDDASRAAQMILTLVIGHVHVFSPPGTPPRRPGASTTAEPNLPKDGRHWAKLAATGPPEQLLDDSLQYLLSGLENGQDP